MKYKIKSQNFIFGNNQMFFRAVFPISPEVMVGFFKNWQKQIGFDKNAEEHSSKIM